MLLFYFLISTIYPNVSEIKNVYISTNAPNIIIINIIMFNLSLINPTNIPIGNLQTFRHSKRLYFYKHFSSTFPHLTTTTKNIILLPLHFSLFLPSIRLKNITITYLQTFRQWKRLHFYKRFSSMFPCIIITQIQQNVWLSFPFRLYFHR